MIDVPLCVLENMSTQAVAQAIWEQAFEWDLRVISSGSSYYQPSFESNMIRLNSYLELCNRKDAGEALYERLLLVNPLTRLFKESQFLELWISQSVFLSQLNNEQKKKIVEITLKNDELREEYSQTRNISYALMGRTMVSAGYPPFVEAMKELTTLKDFLEIIHKPFHIYYDDHNASYFLELERGIELIPQFSKKYINEP